MIPVCAPSFSADDQAIVSECIQTGWVGSGKYVSLFEKSWASYCDRKYGIAVSNGTVALELAIKSLRLPLGKKVILPAFTIVSCALAVVRNGLVPVFVDADINTFCIDAQKIEKVIDDDTVAILVVHMYGHPAEMSTICEIAKRRGLRLIEDAAEAHGATYQGQRCGSFGDVSTFSFYSNKIISTGEGGMILTDDPTIAGFCEDHRNLCFGLGENRFIHTDTGHNYRLTNIQAAIGYSQIKRIGEFLAAKRHAAAYYRKELLNTPLVHQVELPNVQAVHWMHAVLADDKEQLVSHLKDDGIETRPFFFPLNKLPSFSDGATLPVADTISKNGFYLPSGVDLTDQELDRVVSSIRGFYGI